jgi:hypothetical protein
LTWAAPAAAAELIMFEQAGCPFCRRFDREIAPKLPSTAEGRRAPLRRVDIHGPRPADLAWLEPARLTPTFVLVEGGREVGRILGYAGEDFFWPRFEALVRRLPAEAAP